jgi:hypothetical protein
MFLPDPDLYFLPIPDPGSRGQKGTGSGSATLGGGMKNYKECNGAIYGHLRANTGILMKRREVNTVCTHKITIHWHWHKLHRTWCIRFSPVLGIRIQNQIRRIRMFLGLLDPDVL